MNHHDDKGSARIFAALCDPLSLRLLLHALEVGEYDLCAARELGAADPVADPHLERLVDAGLLVRGLAGRSEEVYHVADTAAVEGLLAAVRQLSARKRDA